MADNITYYPDIEQGSDEWLALRCGMITASNMRLIMTSTFKIANNDKTRSHLYELLAQRITKYVEAAYISDDMLRGMADEDDARKLYAEKYAPVETVGFVVNRSLGFPIGNSPDGLVGGHGLIEIKSRRAKYQIETIIGQKIPVDYFLQVQTGLWVTQREWLDFISYSGGLPMMTIRVYPDASLQEAIINAASNFERELMAMMEKYTESLASSDARFADTKRRVEQEMHI